jgi:Uma2 family endonuclease
MLHTLAIGHFNSAALRDRRIIVDFPLKADNVQRWLHQFARIDNNVATFDGREVEFHDGYIVCPWLMPRLIPAAAQFAERLQQETGCFLYDLGRHELVRVDDLWSRSRWAIPPEPARRLTVTQYHQMFQAGIITEDDRCELVDGWLLPTYVRSPPNSYVLMVLHDRIGRVLPDEWILRSPAALTLPDGEPEPAAIICQGPQRRYVAQHPTAADTAIVIEVSDSTLTRDRGIKLQSYARAGIPEYWIVNLVDHQIEIYTQPEPATARYAEPRIILPGDEVSVVLEGKTWLRLSARDLLP